MGHYGSLQKYPALDEEAEVRGARIYDKHGEYLGEITDLIFDHSSGDIHYVVIGSGGWLHSRLFLMPAESLRSPGVSSRDFYVDITKRQAEELPAYEADLLESHEIWLDYEGRYQAAWTGGLCVPISTLSLNLPGLYVPTNPVAAPEQSGASECEDPVFRIARSMHTPEGDSIFSNADIKEMLRESASPDATDFCEDLAPSPQEFGNPKQSIQGRRWINFQNHLRSKRGEIVRHCHICTETKKAA